MRQQISKSKRWVIKLGTSSLTEADGHFSSRQLEAIVTQIVALLHQGVQVIVVSSGAIALGMDTLKLSKRPRALAQLQACAAVGQGKLMKAYEAAFSEHGFHAAQLLLTGDGLQDRRRYVNAKNTLESLLSMGVVPVVNENDTIAADEIKFGDNDILAALVANLADADALIFLSDIEGLYLKDRTLIRHIHSESELREYFSHVHPKRSEKTAGGMKAKLEAARVAMKSGIPIVLANGRDERVIEKILRGDEVGSLFHPVSRKSSARKKWLAHSVRETGTISVDAGAYTALTQGKKSLLAGGIVSSSGNFKVGDPVKLLNQNGEPFARGLINYSRAEIEAIRGLKTKEIGAALGYKRADEVVHRNNLAFLE